MVMAMMSAAAADQFWEVFFSFELNLVMGSGSKSRIRVAKVGFGYQKSRGFTRVLGTRTHH